MEIFVDESGTPKGGQQYFTIAGLIPSGKLAWKRIRNLVNQHCAKLKLPELKAYHMDLPQKQDFIHRLQKSKTGKLYLDHEIHYIVVDKRAITNQSLQQDGNLLFNYAFSFFAKPMLRGINEDITFYVDERNEKVSSKNSLRDYIKLEAIKWGFDHKIEMHYTDSKQVKLVQVADIVANSVLAKYEYGYEHIYRMLDITQSQQFPRSAFHTGT